MSNPTLLFFAYEHLPAHLQEVSKPYHELAHKQAQVPGPESSVAIRKLLEAKDAAVRAALVADQYSPSSNPNTHTKG